MTCHFVGGTANNILFSSQKVKKKRRNIKKEEGEKKKGSATAIPQLLHAMGKPPIWFNIWHK